MASNIQRGTRGLSASDWTRIKRLRGAAQFENDKTNDLVNPGPVAHCGIGSNRQVYCSSGTSKIRRPASSWTHYREASTATFVLESTSSDTQPERILRARRLCKADDASGDECEFAPSPLKHNPICIKNVYDRIVKRS
jgi:hypothetical protein